MCPPFLLLLMASSSIVFAATSQATIIDSGSTNRPGVRVIVNESGDRVVVEQRDGTQVETTIPKKIRERFLRDIEAAAPLDVLPVGRCMKSASFGSRLYVESNGVRTADLACFPQPDPRAEALRKDAEDILHLAQSR